MPAREIERKFLVDALPDGFALHPAEDVLQGYLAIEASGKEVRLRRAGGRFVLTVKRGDGLEREEVEVSLDRAQFEALWPLTAGRRLRKTRTRVPHGRLTIEVDRYHDALDGLIVAEVEFDSVEESRSFAPPSWLGREVTDDDRYKNRCLALDGRRRLP
jgi:CYTH domain-containing protein